MPVLSILTPSNQPLIIFKMLYSWNHMLYSLLDYILHLVLCICDSFTTLHGLIAHFSIVMNSIPLSGCTMVRFSAHLPKDILVPCKIYQLRIELLGQWLSSVAQTLATINIQVRFLCSAFWSTIAD